MSALTIQVDEAVFSALGEFATRFDRPLDSLVSEALDQWLALQKRDIDQIEAGIAEADRGEFVSDEEIARILHKYDVPG